MLAVSNPNRCLCRTNNAHAHWSVHNQQGTHLSPCSTSPFFFFLAEKNSLINQKLTMNPTLSTIIPFDEHDNLVGLRFTILTIRVGRLGKRRHDYTGLTKTHVFADASAWLEFCHVFLLTKHPPQWSSSQATDRRRTRLLSQLLCICYPWFAPASRQPRDIC